MRSFLTLFVAAALALAPMAQADAANLSKREITELLNSRGYPVQDYSSDKLIVDVAEYRILIWIDGADADISYITWLPGISGDEISYSFLNQFNNEVKFGRAYIDSDGDVAIQMDRNSSGGVSAANIESDFDVFLLLISKFLSDLEARAVA